MPSRSSTARLAGLSVAAVVGVGLLFVVRDLTTADDGGSHAGPEPTSGVVATARDVTPLEGTMIVDAEAWRPVDAAPGYADELALLTTIDERDREGHEGYSRGQFGERWADVDGNGCDTRNDVLARDLDDVELRRGSCLVQSGTLHDVYSGLTIEFERGPVSSEAVQIDHRIALYDAWRTGARHWSPALRTQFSNDPANLIAVDGDTNYAKGHADAASWLPPNEAYRCEYVAAQVRIKAAYMLWMTPAEHAASHRVLTGCAA